MIEISILIRISKMCQIKYKREYKLRINLFYNCGRYILLLILCTYFVLLIHFKQEINMPRYTTIIMVLGIPMLKAYLLKMSSTIYIHIEQNI